MTPWDYIEALNIDNTGVSKLLDELQLSLANYVAVKDDVSQLERELKNIEQRLETAAKVLELEERLSKATKAGATKKETTRHVQCQKKGGLRNKKVIVTTTSRSITVDGVERATTPTKREIELKEERDKKTKNSEALEEVKELKITAEQQLDKLHQMKNEYEDLLKTSRGNVLRALNTSYEVSLDKNQDKLDLIQAIDHVIKEALLENETPISEIPDYSNAITKVAERQRLYKFQKLDLPCCKMPRVIEQKWVVLTETPITYGVLVLIGWNLTDPLSIGSPEYQLELCSHCKSITGKPTQTWKRVYNGSEEEFRTIVGPGESSFRVRYASCKGLGKWSPELLLRIDDIAEQERIELEQKKDIIHRNAQHLEYLLFYCCQRAEFLLSSDRTAPLNITNVHKALEDINTHIHKSEIFNACSTDIQNKAINLRDALIQWTSDKGGLKEWQLQIRTAAIKMCETDDPLTDHSTDLEKLISRSHDFWKSMTPEFRNMVFQVIVSVCTHWIESNSSRPSTKQITAKKRKSHESGQFFTKNDKTTNVAERWIRVLEALTLGQSDLNTQSTYPQFAKGQRECLLNLKNKILEAHKITIH